MRHPSNTTRSVNALTLLTLLFIGLKLSNNIDWSWWYVLMPFYLPIVIIMMIFAIKGIVNK